MKKILLISFAAVTLSSCHYLREEARETLKTNEQYKTEKTEYSINRADVQVKENQISATDSIQ